MLDGGVDVTTRGISNGRYDLAIRGRVKVFGNVAEKFLYVRRR
jgi:hypothetical protein